MQLTEAVRESLPLGAPVGRLLREAQPLLRREERQLRRLQALEGQFAFQGAIAVVLPWAVVGIAGELTLNAFMLSGIVFQLLGIGLFYCLLRGATRRPRGESAWCFELLISVWTRVLAGLGLYAALRASIERAAPSGDRHAWLEWLGSRDGGVESFAWPETMPVSRGLANLLESLLKSGAPCADVLADCIAQLEDERQDVFEERVSSLPTRLSLIFCGCFTPAVFLLLLGGLWPMLSLWM